MNAQCFPDHSVEIWESHQCVIIEISMGCSRLRHFLHQLALNSRIESQKV